MGLIMIESKTLGDAVGIQRGDVIDNSTKRNWAMLSDGMVIGRFKRGRMDRPFIVTAANYQALLGYDPSNPSFVVVDDAFRNGLKQLTVMRLGNPMLATAQVVIPPKPDNELASVAINGVFRVGEVLTAVTTDPNGVPNDIVYRWLADDVEVSTESSYSLTEADKGKVIILSVTFIDNDGFTEAAISEPSAPVAALNKPASVIINGELIVGQTLTATISDANGVPSNIAYRWMVGGIEVSVASSYLLSENDKGETVALNVAFDDNDGFTELVTSTPSAPVAALNKASNVIINGTIKVGEILSATVTDANGIPNDIAYQWFADSVAISGATAKTYVLKVAEVGKAITVTASFTDNDGFTESATSAASVVVEVLSDPYYDKVLMLFKMNGNAIDEKGYANMQLENSGRPVAFEPSPFGLSARFYGVGTTNYVDKTPPLLKDSLSGVAFTIEFFSKLPLASTGSKTVLSFGKGSSADQSWSIELNTTYLRFVYSTTGTGSGAVGSGVSLSGIDTTSRYVHYAISRDATGLTHFYADGVLLASRTLPSVFYHATVNGLTIGRLNYDSYPYDFEGRVGQIRITRTVSRYNGGGFTPPLEFPTR